MSELERNKVGHHPGCYETWNEYTAGAEPAESDCVCNLTMGAHPGAETELLIKLRELLAGWREMAPRLEGGNLQGGYECCANELEAILGATP